MEILFVKKNPLQDLLSSLNAVISTNERNWILTGYVIFKLHYNQIYQLKTTNQRVAEIEASYPHDFIVLDSQKKCRNTLEKVSTTLGALTQAFQSQWKRSNVAESKLENTLGKVSERMSCKHLVIFFLNFAYIPHIRQDHIFQKIMSECNI